MRTATETKGLFAKDGTMKHGISRLSLAAAALAALFPLAAAAEAEPEGGTGNWRISAGYRAAPGIKTSAGVDAGAAARAAGAVLRPAGGNGTSRSSSTEKLGSSFDGTTEADAQARSGYIPGQTRYEFDNGYVDFDDGTGRGDDTTNWHFESSDAFADGAVSAERAYDGTTVTRSRSTETETTRSSSFRESFADGLSDSSDETAHGAELRFDRTLWRGERFGVDVGIGWAWFGDIDVFSIRGRAYSGSAATRAVTRSTATDTVTTRTESGTVVTKLSQPEFANADDIRNRDGSIGGAYVAGGDLPDGYQAPVLVVTSDRFSTETRRDAATTTTKTTSGGTKTSSTSSSTTRTVDVRSEGTLSLQEVRAGFQPFWKVSDWLLFRADFGVIATYSELETRTELSVDGVRAGVVERDEHDWTLAGYAGGGISVAVGRHVELFANAEARFPDKSLHFGDGIASGTIDLAQWSASAGVCVRF